MLLIEDKHKWFFFFGNVILIEHKLANLDLVYRSWDTVLIFFFSFLSSAIAQI